MRNPLNLLFLSASVLLILPGCSLPGSNVAQNTFTSIHDAITKAIPLQCEYTDDTGEKTIALIKGNQVRLDSAATNTTSTAFHGIIRENKMWIWADEPKEGGILDFSKITDDSVKMGDKVIRSQDDIIAKLEENKDTCKGTIIDDNKFVIPSDITFQAGN